MAGDPTRSRPPAPIRTPHSSWSSAPVAWRNSARCIGRLYWKSLRSATCATLGTGGPRRECITHLHESTRGGRIRSTVSDLRAGRPAHPGPQIHNDQLIRYAGYRMPTARCAATGATSTSPTERSRPGGHRPSPAAIRRAAAADLRRGPVQIFRCRTTPSSRWTWSTRNSSGSPTCAAVARTARDQQHAAAHRWHHLPRGALQRLVPQHRDRHATSPTPTGTPAPVIAARMRLDTSSPPPVNHAISSARTALVHLRVHATTTPIQRFLHGTTTLSPLAISPSLTLYHPTTTPPHTTPLLAAPELTAGLRFPAWPSPPPRHDR